MSVFFFKISIQQFIIHYQSVIEFTQYLYSCISLGLVFASSMENTKHEVKHFNQISFSAQGPP